MKKFKELFTNGTSSVLLFFLLLSPIFAIGLYKKSNDLEMKLVKVCGAHKSIVETLRNESLDEEIKRLKAANKFPDNSTLVGKVESHLQGQSLTVSSECNNVYGLIGSFPTYNEIEFGYGKYLSGHRN